MRRISFLMVGIALVALALTGLGFAQSTATLSGTVVDSSGAVVPGANITVTNQASGDNRKTVTNGAGHFSVPALQVGTYKLVATAKGFATYTATDIVLTAADSKSVTISLPMVSVQETVEVSATQTEVAVLDSGEKSASITAKDLQDATLQSRNAAEIVKYLSGASMTHNGGKNTAFSTPTIGINGYTVGGTGAGLGGTQINGQSLDITMDGGHIFDPGAAGGATPVNPNTDMISEVKVLASNFSAEYEKGPVVVNIQSKSGGNVYHGDIHLVAQNAAMNATDASIKAAHMTKGDSYAYYPGAQIGGPIPFGSYNKKRDKLFFFEAFEAYRQNVDGGLARAVVPTDRMLAGDFSASALAGLRNLGTMANVPVYNGTDWTPWQSQRPGCVINAGVLSAGCISQNGVRYLTALTPRPNNDPTVSGLLSGYNWVWNVNATDNSWQNITKEDWAISDNTKAFVRYSAQRETSFQPLGLWGNSGATGIVPAPTPIIGNYASDSLAVSLTHAFSPSMTSETTFTYTFEGMPNTPEDWSKLSRADLGITTKPHWGDQTGSQQVMASTAWGASFPYLGSGNNLGNDFSPVAGVRSKPGMIADKGMPSLRQNFSKVLNTHTLKFGAYWEKIYNKQDNWNTYMGVAQMPQGWGTGVGNNYADVLMGIIPADYSEAQLPPPTQIQQNLYEFFVNDHWKINRRLTVDIGMRFDHYGRPFSANDLGLAIFDTSKYSNDPAQLDAHTGISWHGLDSSIPLSGSKSRVFFYSPRFGLAWDVFGDAKTVLRGGWGLFRTYDSLQSDNYTRPAGQAIGAGNFSCNAWSCATWEDIDAHAVNHPLPAGLPAGLQGITVMDPTNNQQPLIKTFSMSIDQRLPAKFLLELSYVGNRGTNFQNKIDINAVPVGTVSHAYLVTCNAPGGNCNYDPFRPRTSYQGITESLTIGGSQYDALQVSLHRNIGFLNVMANYTWSKTFGIGDWTGNGFADYGASEYWGISPQHRPHIFNLAYTINVPKPNVSSAFLRGLGSGWQIGGVTTLQSGANQTAQHYALNYGQDDNVAAGIFNSNVGMLGSNGVTLHATIVCDPRVNESVTLSDGTVARRFLNPDCFAPAAAGTAGTTNMPYLPGPKFFNTDLSVTRNFNLTERQRLAVKIQAFNFVNHPLWSFNGSDPNLQLKFNADGTMKNRDMFGVTQSQYGHRTLELSVRYTF